MNDPRRQLRSIIDTAHNLLAEWTRYAETAAALVDTNSDRLGVHGGDTCDPVYAGALANQQWQENCTEIAEALGHLRSVERRVLGTAAHHPETARLLDAVARAARCADPVCTDNAVKDGLCFTHWNLARRTGS